MDREHSVVGELEHDHLEQVPGPVRSDCEHLRGVSICVEIHDDDRVIRRVSDVGISNPVPSRRTVDLHTGIS